MQLFIHLAFDDVSHGLTTELSQIDSVFEVDGGLLQMRV